MGHKHSVSAPSSKQLSSAHGDVLAWTWREYQQALQASSEGQEAYESPAEEWAARYRLVSSCIAHPGKPFVAGSKPHPKSSFAVTCKGHRFFWGCVPHGGFAREGMLEHCYMLWLVKEVEAGSNEQVGDSSPVDSSQPPTVAQLPATGSSAAAPAAAVAFDTQAILSSDQSRVWHRAHMFRTLMLSAQSSPAVAAGGDSRAQCVMSAERSDFLLRNDGAMMEAKWAACNGNLEQFFAE